MPSPAAEVACDGRATVVLSAEGAGDSTNRHCVVPRVRGYDILSVIGTGGMGIVYKARHWDLQRIVALKTLRGAAMADFEFRDRIQAEAMAVARLQHPNIIQVFEVGLVDAVPGEMYPSPFIALEYVDGGSLSRRVDKPQPATEVAALVLKLARAVQVAHDLGVVHRDLKPANVLLTHDGEPKIVDFGLAKQVGASRDSSGRFATQAGILMGTPEYMAPEQASGAPPTPAMDIYSLGVILYELLTARVPFQAAGPMETIELARNQEPVSPRRLQPHLPRDLETICLKCLEKTPDRRYPSAAALADDLQRFLSDQPILVRRTTNLERWIRWCRRNPLVAGSLGGVIGIFLVAFLLVSRSYWRTEEARQLAVRQGQEAEKREEAERWERYRANILTASTCQVHNVAAARRALESAPEEHRNWEWRHFHSRLDLALQVLSAPGEELAAAWIAPRGRHVVTVGNGGLTRLWDAKDQRFIRTLDKARDLEWKALSRDGRWLAGTTPDHAIVLRNLSLDQADVELLGHEAIVHTLAFCDDGSRVISASADMSIRVWEARTGKLLSLLRVPGKAMGPVSPLPDGRTMAFTTSNPQSMQVWNLDTGRPTTELLGHEQHVESATANWNCDRLVTVERFPSCIMRLWDLPRGQMLTVMSEHTNTITEVAFSPDGSRIATSSRDQTVCLWNGRTGQFIGRLKGHLGWVNTVAFSRDGKRVASASRDRTVRLWDAETGDSLAVLNGHMKDVTAVAFSEDGSGIVSASADGTIRCWDARAIESNGMLRGHSTFVYGVAFHPDGERIASASWDGTARIWDAGSGRQLAALTHGDKAYVTSVAFHPGGLVLASRARDAVRLWDVASGKELHRWNVPGDFWRDTRVAFNRTGTLIAAGCEKREIRVWNVETRAEVAVLRGHTDEVRDIVFSPDGRWLASVGEDSDRTVRIWDLARREQVRVLTGHDLAAYAVAFSADGSLLASGSTDGTVRLWNTSSWDAPAILRIGASVYGVAFTPDGTRLACACADNSIRFWDTRTHQDVADLRGHDSYVHQVAFSPDGSRMASASGDGIVRVWDTLRPQDRSVRGR